MHNENEHEQVERTAWSRGVRERSGFHLETARRRTQGPVTSERLLKAADEPGNWLMYSHNYNSWRFSSLDQINAQTVKNLHVKWIFQGRHIEKFETTPLVVEWDHVSDAP